MDKAPKSLRLQIGLFGRTNVGKSSLLNMICGQDFAITSAVAGTTTDVVEKTMELLPLGPVVFLDTAGVNDTSELAAQRLKKTEKIFDRADIVVLITEPDVWGGFEELVVRRAGERGIPVLTVINKTDIKIPGEDFTRRIKENAGDFVLCSCVEVAGREKYIAEIKRLLFKIVPEDFLRPPTLIGDLMPSGGLAVLIVPIDLQAPKGRLILPQVQTIRDALDNDSAVMVVKEREYTHFLTRMNKLPDLAVCDSQVCMKMVADTPETMKCTTFSILFARYKGDLLELVRGAEAIDTLEEGDNVLISEACSHHAIEDDIGRVKIPRWLRQYIGCDLNIDVCSGRDFPEDVKKYKLIISCGGCMLTRREMLWRISLARQSSVPITNYGVCISKVQGVLKRVLSPFPAALELISKEENKSKVGSCHEA